ncbi:Transposable element Tc3 transposase [Porphyridium purpureum]|uniref:Transposable element Tc3 transposase n=1 Tax=Porphyridium purpureum TaxID=35688 RepID=A0A5J4YVJ3_PORPP|nr:Transposable element Tc3 transposase [Porphyridium purpureum]|eukprot:POR5937..scf227_4
MEHECMLTKGQGRRSMEDTGIPTLKEVYALLSDEHACIQFLMSIGVLAAKMRCPTLTGLARSSVRSILVHVRQCMVEYNAMHEAPIGGQDVIVEIDESKFGKRKYHRGHRVDGVWVLAGVERTEERRLFMTVVPNRTTRTLIPIIQQRVHPGSIIHTDCWKSYFILKYHPTLRHYTVNHEMHFKDPVTGVHTNTGEGTWRAVKATMPDSAYDGNPTASIGNMAPRLSDFEKGQIDALHRLCLTPRAIAARLRPRPDKTRPSYKTVERFLKNRGKKRVFKKPGPARTISPKLERRLIRHVITDRLTSAQAVTELQLACSARTVRRILQRSPEVRLITQRRKFFISEKNRVKRLAFAREYVHKPLSFWKNVIFSDEKIFRLDGPHGTLHRVQGSLNAERYRQVMLNVMMPWALELPWRLDQPDCPFIFQQDNAPGHTALSTRELFDTVGIALLDWPARSPDLNLVENLWAIVSHRVHWQGRQFMRLDDMLPVIYDCWRTEAPKYVEALFESMPRRLQACIDAGGRQTKY